MKLSHAAFRGNALGRPSQVDIPLLDLGYLSNMSEIPILLDESVPKTNPAKSARGGQGRISSDLRFEQAPPTTKVPLQVVHSNSALEISSDAEDGFKCSKDTRSKGTSS